MSDMRHREVIDDERAVQRDHAELLHTRELRRQGVDPTSNPWTRTGIPESLPPDAELLGRIALAAPEEILDGHADYYIGRQSNWVGELRVYPWSAPVAATLFGGATNSHEWCTQVAVRRTFVSRLGWIEDFEDETLASAPPERPFRSRTLNVPEAPGRPLPKPKTMGVLQPVEEASKAPATASPQPPRPTIRAERLLRAQLAAPRASSLSPALATLQPEQYDLVTKASDVGQIIEGQPGTGKTIIASHRAAYLVTEDPEAIHSISGDVLLVGPTRGYSNHVRQVIERLADRPQNVFVLSLPELAQKILGTKNTPDALTYQSRYDADADLFPFVRAAIEHLKKAEGVTPSPEGVYEHLRASGTGDTPLTEDEEWIDYLSRLPPFREALKRQRALALLAAIHWEVEPPPELRRIEHIIVDEAQDVTGLEWSLLSSIHRGRGWTILGDLNQRRSDYTVGSWSQIMTQIRLDADTEIHTVRRGYRSTKAILDFANRLLPKDKRPIDALQAEGPAPSVVSAKEANLMGAAAEELVRLADTYPDGTLAAITMNVAQFKRELRDRGWIQDSRVPSKWIAPDDRSVTIAEPDDTRGLEFDGVVVIEPDDFPRNYGRHGPLYTSLTRPNRELAVVHSRALPDPLTR